VTAGLVVFAVNPNTRHCYHDLFETRQIHKTYQAIANINTTEKLIGQQWGVKNRIVKSEPQFRMCISAGEANSHSMIHCLQQRTHQALFELTPISGKTHQLRVHMQSIGFPIVNDKYYPILQPLSVDDYDLPLQFLAKKIEFIDPISKEKRCFSYDRDLLLR
jgi:tRNA pseudouridine32 synthase/23S rRNA pseudouridine746 synthase